MAQNGRAKKPKNAANGTLNGSANGNGHMNGHADKTTSNPSSLRVRKPRRTMAGAFTSIAARYVIEGPEAISAIFWQSPGNTKKYFEDG